MNCCKRERTATKEYGKKLKRILFLKEGRIPAKEAKGWKIEWQKRSMTGKEY